MTMHREWARHGRRFAAGMLCAVAAGAATAQAPDYPARPITLVVPFAAGSGTDQLTRALANAITLEYKVPVVVDVRPGANGFIAAQYVAKAAPDGYTALSTTNTTHAANEHLYIKLPYDPVKDFTPVILISKGHMALMVNPASSIRSVADLLAEAKKSPGKLSFGSGSSSSRVAGELLRQMAAIEVLHVPYKSNPHGVTDLIGGQIDFMFADSSVALPQINAGKLRALAVSGTRRMSSLPAVPTVAEAGITGYDMSYWSAIYLPANVPAAVVKKLNEMVVRASASPAMAAFQGAISAEVALSTPEGLAAFQATESQKWGRVIRGAGIVRE
jgi:tripartite-type tricarboxylate transporter receptor subunit TctC